MGPRRRAPHLARGAAGTPASQPPTRKEAHLRYGPERGTKQNLPRLTHPESPGWRGVGGDFRRLPQSFALPGFGQGPRRARGAVGRSLPARRGQVPAGWPARAHSPRGRSCPLFQGAPRLARVPRPARGSQPSRRSGETMRVTARLPGTRARGAPPLPWPYPLLVFRTFCLPKPKSLTHPSQLQPLSPCLQVPYFWAQRSRAENSW